MQRLTVTPARRPQALDCALAAANTVARRNGGRPDTAEPRVATREIPALAGPTWVEEEREVSGLTQSSCVPCRGGVPTLSDPEIASLMPQVADWRVTEIDGVKRLEREFRFKDWKSAMAFAVQVGELAEREQHHPDLHVAWGRVRVETWTHKIRGLHRNDFVLAAKVDEIYAATARA